MTHRFAVIPGNGIGKEVVTEGLRVLDDETGSHEVALADLLRDIFGDPFGRLPTRGFPSHVVALAQECYQTLPADDDCVSLLLTP